MKNRPLCYRIWRILSFTRFLTDSFMDWFQGLGLEASGNATAKCLGLAFRN